MNIETALPAELETALYKLAHEASKKDKDWIEAQETFDILDDAKKSYFASIVEEQLAKTTAEKERMALTSPEWGEWMRGYQTARKNARVAKLEAESTKRLWETCRSILSSKNSERRYA